MVAQLKYNALYHDDWAWSLAAMGATNEEIAEAMSISKRTVIRWAKEHESFGRALTEGKGVSDAKVVRSLYQRATGYEVTERKKVVEYDKEGNVKPVRVEEYNKHIPADVGAMCFWLKNRQRDRWQDRPMEIHNEEKETEVQIYLPDNRRDGGLNE